MAAAFSERAAAETTWDWSFRCFLGLRSCFLPVSTFYSTVRMPKHPLFRDTDHGTGWIRRLCSALIGLVLVYAGVRIGCRTSIWFSSRLRLHVPVHLVSGTFPRYRFDQLMKVGWKVLAAHAGLAC